jgi:hypothetical protein
VRSAARLTSLPETSIYAILRQESLYRADAGSSAGALGLMQLLPSTARRTARRWDLKTPSPGDLLDPSINVPIGAAELRNLLDNFDGQPFAAYAAYNAGPGAARRWLPLTPVDADVWSRTYRSTRRGLMFNASPGTDSCSAGSRRANPSMPLRGSHPSTRPRRSPASASDSSRRIHLLALRHSTRDVRRGKVMPSSNRADLRALVVLGAIAGGLWLPVALRTSHHRPIAAFSHTPGFTEVALSPDGTLLAMDEPAPPNYRIVMLRHQGRASGLRTIARRRQQQAARARLVDDRTVLMDASVTNRIASETTLRVTGKSPGASPSISTEASRE